MKKLSAFLLCSSLIWVSPGLEAFAAEGRAVELSITPQVNPAGAAIKPIQLSLPGVSGVQNLGSVNTLPSVGVEGITGPASLGLETEGATPRSNIQNPGAASLVQPQAGAAVPAAEPASANVPANETAPVVDPSGASAASASSTEIPQLAKGRAANTSRIGAALRSFLDLFKGKKTETLSDAGPAVDAAAAEQKTSPEAKLNASSAQAPPQEGSGEKQPPVPPSKPADDGGKGKPSAWRNAWMFVAGLIVAQIGVEAWSAAWAKWVQTNFNTPHHDVYTTVTMVAMGTGLVAGLAGGWLADKFGLKRTIVGTLVMVAATAGATLLMFQFHLLTAATPALLIGLVVARAFFNSANGTAEATMPIAIFKDDKAALQKFNSSSQFILEIAGIAVPYGIGALLGAFGFVGTMWIMPATLVAASLILAFFMRVKETKKAKSSAPAKDEPTDSGLLKIAGAGYPALVLLNYLLYAVISIGYGNFLHPGASAAEQAAASGVAGKIVSLYSAGGLIAAAILSGVPQAAWKWLKSKWPWLNKKAQALAEKLPARFKPAAPAEDDPHADAKSAAKWLIFAAIGMAGFVPLLWSSPLLAALAMIPFGITNVMSTLQLISIAQSNTPQSKKGKVMGVIRSVSTALGTAGIFAFSKLFEKYPGSHFPFMIFVGLGGVLAAYYVFTSIRLRRHIKKHQA